VTPFADNSIAELSIRAETVEVRRASAWLEQASLDRGVPPEEIARIELCLNEALANVISHSGNEVLSSPISLQFQVHRDQSANAATLMVSDSGTPFDPFSISPQPRPKTLAEAEPGGLGLLMMRNLADKASYRYLDGRNQITFSVHWAEGQ